MRSTPAASRSVHLALVACLALPACGVDADPAGEGQGSGSGSASADPDGPQFLAFGADKTTLGSPAERIVISAALTDPDGIDDVVGGTLERDGALLRAFATSAAEGAYSVDLDGKTVVGDRVVWGEPAMIELTAVFFDQAGHRASRSLVISFECPDDLAYEDGLCIQPFTSRSVTTRVNCREVTAQIDTPLTCADVCATYDEPVFGDPDQVMVEGAECTCGGCEPR